MGKGRRENPSSSCPHLPPVDWWDILILLPAKSLVPLRAVCKAWRSVIDDPFFINKHHQIITSSNNNKNNTILIRTSPTSLPFAPYYSVDLDALIPTETLQTIPATPARLLPAEMPLATCHGLIFDNEMFEIYNPLFDDRLKLPQRGDDGFTLFPDPHKYKNVGLGYDRATDDYKAVVIDCSGRTYVYSLRSSGGSWRRIGDCPYVGYLDPGLYVGGALHWMSSWNLENIIFALDLETEEYRKLNPPPFREYPRSGERFSEIDVLDGCLVVTDFCSDDSDFTFDYDTWVFEEGSWTRLFSLGDKYNGEQILHIIRPVAYMKNKTHILLQDYKTLYLGDAETGELKRVSIRGLHAWELSAQLFQETLIRPKHICGGGGVVDGQGRKKMWSNEKKRKRKTWMFTQLCFILGDISDPSDLDG